jgi:hypothetical protein
MCINVIIDIWVISGLSVLFVEEAGVQVNKIEKIYINKSIWLQIVKSISVIHIPVLLILVYILNDFISI